MTVFRHIDLLVIKRDTSRFLYLVCSSFFTSVDLFILLLLLLLFFFCFLFFFFGGGGGWVYSFYFDISLLTVLKICNFAHHDKRL